MELLAYVSQTCGLVTGSETGHDAAVPVRTLLRRHAEPGALPRSRCRARHDQNSWTKCPSESRNSRPATTTACRCGNWSTTTASSPNGIGATTTTNCRRCGTAAICRTPSTARHPCSCSIAAIWQQNRDRFVQSYQTATPVARATGYSEMLAHRWLTDDHAVQQTRVRQRCGRDRESGRQSVQAGQRRHACAPVQACEKPRAVKNN